MQAYGKVIAPSSIQHDTLTIRTTNPVVIARLQIQSKLVPKRVLPEIFLQGFLIFALPVLQAPLVFPEFLKQLEEYIQDIIVSYENKYSLALTFTFGINFQPSKSSYRRRIQPCFHVLARAWLRNSFR